MKQEKWQLKKAHPGHVSVLREALGISEIVAQVLVNRGITTPEEGITFLRASTNDLKDPFLLPGMDKAAERLLEAIESREKIAVWGDYDADGVTATALLVRVLRKLGGDVCYYLPNRFTEGYGLNLEGIKALAEKKVTLLVTVDSGISACEEVELAGELGMDVIITDHHEPQAELPAACAILNPKLGETLFRELAGVGVAFKLCQAVSKLATASPLKPQELCHEYLDLVALGTVADVVPLLGENRIMVKAGMELLASTQNPGLAALVAAARINGKPISTYHLGFVLGPRLNAVGRLGDAEEAVQLLLTDDPQEAQTLAQTLNELNSQRQRMCDDLTEAVHEAIAREGQKDAPVIVVGGDGWHHGIIGIVASRIAESYRKPTILIAWEGEEGRGSGRSLPGFHLFDALSRCQDLLIRYGGHAQAAGLTISRDKLGQLREALIELAKEPDFQLEEPVLELDGELLPSELSFELLGELELLEPFGEQNPNPLFLASGITVQHWSWVGEGAQHLRLSLADYTGCSLGGIGYRMGDLAARMEEYLQSRQRIDVAYRPLLDDWGGTRKITMDVKALRLHHGPERAKAVLPAIPVLEQEGYTILDARDVKAKDEYIASLLTDGARPLLYCPSFEEAQKIRSRMQELLPKLAARILLLGEPESFRRLAQGQWSLAVWPLPLWTEDLERQIRFLEHLIFFLPPVDPQAFSELAAFGQPSFIHLLFGREDLQETENSRAQIPNRDALGKLFLLLRQMAQTNPFLPEATLIQRIQRGADMVWQRKWPLSKLIFGIEIFCQLGILKREAGGFRFSEPEGKLNLAASSIYRLRQEKTTPWLEADPWNLQKLAKIIASGREAAS